jgi:hypothetical protein
MIIALLFGLLVGNTTQLQLKYEHCKSLEFKGEYCELQKKLSEIKK